MTRQQAKANLEKLGFAEVTDEMVTNYLNQLDGETNGLKTKLAQAEKDALNVKDLQEKIKELEDSKLTDEEKAAKATEEAQKTIIDLQNKVVAMELKTQLAEIGITGEDADKLIENSNGGSLDVALLGTIISNRETEAAKKKEQEIADKSTNPNGGSAGGEGGGDDKPADVLNAESMKEAFGVKPNDDNKNYYVLK